MQNSVAKKIFAVGSAAAMLAAFALPMSALAAAHPEGTNVNKSGTVGMIIGGQFRPYTSAGAFLSYGFNSWASVVAASAEDLALPTGAFIPPQDGTVFCATETKGSDVKGECSLVTAGTKAAFTSASVFSGLGFSFSRAQYGDSSFLSKSANVDNTTAAHRTGVLVNNNGTVQLVGASGLLGIPDLATFNSWGYSFANVVPANAADKAMTQTGVMAARMSGQLSPSWTTTPSTPGVVSGSVSASLSSNNPVSSTLVVNQGLANIAEFTFSGTGTVTGVALKRIGVSADTTLNNVYLFEGATRLTDGASVSSGSVVNFSNASGLFTVNGTKTISVKATMAGTSGETVGLQLTSFTVANGTPATVAISGNLHTMATATLAGFSFAAATGSGTTDPGKDILLWQSVVTVSTRDVNFSRLAMRQIGSIQSADINNFRLLVDGVQIAQSQSLDSNGYVTFTFDKVMKTGSRTVKVLGDVIGGSGRTVQMSLRGIYDVTANDSQYNAAITSAATGGFPVSPATSPFSISAGTMTVVKTSDSQSANITKGATDQSLAKYTFTAYGESIKVENLYVGVITTGGTATDVTLRNVRVLANGSQVGSTTNVPAAATYATGAGTSFTTNFMVVPGTPATVEIRGDVVDTTDAGGDTTDDIAAGTVTAIQALLVGGASANNAIPQVSLGTLDVPSQTNVTGNALTIATGSISTAQQSGYAAQTIVVPQTAYKLGAFNLTGNSTEAVNINTLTVDFTPSVGATFSAADLTDVYLKYGAGLANQSSVKGTVSATAGANTWSVNFQLGKNETVPVEIYATIGSTITATHSITADFEATGVTADSGTTVYSGAAGADAVVTGQVITANTGSLTVSVDATAPNATLVDDSGVVTTAAFKFESANDAYTVTDITVTLGNATPVQTVTLKAADGSDIAGTGVKTVSKPGATTLTFSGLSLAVPSNVAKVVNVELTMGTIGVGGGSTGQSILTTLTSATARSSGGTSAAVTESPSNPAGNAMYAYKAIPTITLLSLPTSALTAGGANQTLAKFSVSSGGTGTIGWGKLLFTVTKNLGGTDTVTNATLWNADSNTEITGNDVISGLGDGANGSITFVPTVEEQISGARTYELKADIGGTAASGETVTTNITQPSGYVASAQGFDAITSGGTYYDADNGATVTASDVRLSAVDSYAATLTGTATGTRTTVLSKFLNDLSPTTTTFTYNGSVWAGTGWTVSGSSATGFIATNDTDGSIVTLSAINTAVNGITVIVAIARTDNGYAAGTAAAATNTDLDLAITGGVANAASFVWTDKSAQSHTLITTDWNNGYLVKTLPTTTWTLSK